MKFKESITTEQRAQVPQKFAELQDKIPYIVEFEWGLDVSVEGLNNGFTHIFILTFKSAKDRDAYLVDNDHEIFKQWVFPLLDKVMVIDYWTKL